MSRGKKLFSATAGLVAASLTMVPFLLGQVTTPANRGGGSVSKNASPGLPAVVEMAVEDAMPGFIPSAPPPGFGGRVSDPTPPPPMSPYPPVRRAYPFANADRHSPYTGILLVQDKKEGKDQVEQKTPAAPETAPATPTPYSLGLFGLGKGEASLSAGQQAGSAGAKSIVTGAEGQAQNAGGSASNLLSNSNSAVGVEVQKRSSLVGDPRIEGFHFGQIITQADGAYWFPARVDLDTVVSKLNSDNINNIVIVKGPFSARYGPGFSFLDIESVPTPRYKDGGFNAQGSTSVNYRTNTGQQVTQNIWGGNADWGFRLSYDAQSANDYRTGNGTQLPSGYNNQFVNFAYGMNLSSTESVDVRYLHVQQNNVLFPGLLTDINSLTTDGVTGRYLATDGAWFDRFVLEAWVNHTRFNGDSNNQGTRNQIPQLDNIFPAASNPALAGFGPVRLDINTNGTALSYGAREITTWGDAKGFNLSTGADLRVFQNQYNEFDAFNLSVANGTVGTTGTAANFGIPNARWIDPGLFADTSIPYGENMVTKLGGRVDFSSTEFLNFGPNVDVANYNKFTGDPTGNKQFFLFSGFATNEYKVSEEWKMQTGYGYAQRAPTLTELYAGGSFLGLIQNGLNSINGNPNLAREQIHQLDFSVRGNYERVRTAFHAFYAFAPDYITYRNVPNAVTGTSNFAVNVNTVGTGITPIRNFQFINTPEAQLYGFDGFGEVDALPWLTPFITASFVDARDLSHHEWLPGIPPLASRMGLRVHDVGDTPRWSVEYFARAVATQSRIADYLGEQRTAGFVVHYLRAYWQARENVLLLAGIENIGNLQYREHLDLRTGNGVFQPGINFYFGTKINY